MPIPQIDPNTGERVAANGNAPQIDPATGERISATPPAQPAPTGELRAAPTGIVPWFNDLENDLRHGGGRTVVGRTLGHLQGQGDKGYTGLEAGASPGQADFMGSVPLGATNAAKGAAELGWSGQPGQGLKDIVSGTAQAATVPSAFMGGPIAEGADAMIPSRLRAGQVLGDIGNAAKDVPVIPRATMPAVGRWSELTEAGGKTAKPITKLSNRLTDYLTPATKEPQEPMLFPEARDRYSNITDLTRQPKLQTLMGRGLKPTMLRQAGNVRTGLNSDLTDAASTIGRGEDYTNAMTEYAQAAKLAKALKLGGLAIGAEGLRRLGLLGKIAGAVTPTQ
jgi:hypothetical protein